MVIKSTKFKSFTEYKKSLFKFKEIQLEEKDKNASTTSFFCGIEKDTHKKVFIKRFNKKLDMFNEFQVESYVLEDINQKNIIKPIAVFDERKFNYIVFPYAEGGDLFDLMYNQQIVFNDQQLTITAFALLSALEKIHSKGYIYRDLKLENVVFQRKFEELLLNFNEDDIMLIDFGSCYVESKSISLGSFKGTKLYYPPEYLFYQRVTDKFDIFQLGVLLYFLAVSYFPFNPNYQYDELEMSSILSEEFIDYLFEEEGWSEHSPKIKKLIKSMLLYDDNSRPSSKELLKNDIFSNLLNPYQFIDEDDEDEYTIY